MVRLAAAPLAVAYAVAALVVARGPGRFTTYAGASEPAAALTAAAGLALIAAAIVLGLSRRSRTGDVAVVAGVVWFAPLWIGWEGGPRIVRSLGLLAAGFVLPLLTHLVLAQLGALRSAAARVLLAVLYLGASLSAVGRALVRNPLLDVNCWDDCTDNVFVVHAYPRVAGWIHDVDVWFAGAGGAALAALCAWRLASSTAPARRAIWPASIAGALIGAATVARSVTLLRRPIEEPSSVSFRAIFEALCAAVVLLAAGLMWTIVRAKIQQRSLARIVNVPPPGSLESALGRVLGDPELRVAYWLPASRRYADARGRPLPDPGPGATTVVRDGRRVAAVTHSAALSELERRLGAAVLLSLENERLQAELLAQLEDLRASRARIVETADTERRRLERDLHDGAQQSLLALSYEIRLARAAADGEHEAVAMLAEASSDAEEALDELRELAHGIYPAVLADAGLSSALRSLAETALLPVAIRELPAGRYPSAVENAAYVAAAEAIEDATRRSATGVELRVHSEIGVLTVEVHDDGADDAAPLVSLADRVGALGGRLEHAGGTLRAELPLDG